MTVRIGKFEKISIEQWEKDTAHLFTDNESGKSFQSTTLTDIIKLPTRATKGSAGYDIVTPIGIHLEPKQSIKIPTGLKCMVDNGWFLGIFPKSGLGFKYSLRLGNSIGVIDEDYYNNENNEGHIWVKIQNDGDKIIDLERGKAFCQGIFLPYGITYDDETDGERKGGLGSTNK